MSLEDLEKEVEFAVTKTKRLYCFETRLVKNPMNPHSITGSENRIVFKCKFLFKGEKKTGGVAHYQEYIIQIINLI